MKKLIARFLAWLDARRDNRQLYEAARYWAKQGAVAPYAQAEHERFLRLKLEEFRNFASKRYLEDPRVTQKTIRNEWIEENIKPMLAIPFCAEDGRMLLGAVETMGDEMFHGAARRARDLEMDLCVMSAYGKSAGIKKAQRDRAMRIDNVR